MNLQLRNKLEDFTVWTVLSFEHFQAKRFADALTNMRKAGEAASKLIIFYNFSNTVSELKIAQKGYKELINQLIADNLVPRKMINWLETFQIHGNIATHDNKVAQIQAEYGNIALKLLVSWLFQEYLKTEIPLTMQHFIAQEQDTEQLQQQAKVLISSLDEAKINVAKLEKELQTKQQSLEHTEALKKDLKTAVSKVKELEASQQKISSLRGELQKITLEKEQLKIELEKAKQERTISVEPLPEKSVSKGKKKIVFAGLMGILLLVCIIFIYKYYPFNAASLSSTKENNSSFKVLILPFSVMQSNLNLTVKIEEKIRERLIEKSEAEKISVEVLYRPEKDKSILTYKQASQIAKMQNADFIVFGNINEQESGGSVHATIKYSFNYKNDNFFLDTLMSFEQLSINSADIKEEKLQNKTNNITDIAIACNLILNKKNYTDALLFLNKTDAVSKKQDVIALQLLARCYIMTNNYPKAKNIMEKLQKIYPDNIYILRYLIGIVSDGEQKYNEAEKLIQKGLALDAENIDLMVDYANLLYSIYKQFIQAKTYALKAVQKDSTNARAQYALAIILDTYFNDYKNAYVHYLKTVELNPQNNIAKRKVGEILAFELNEPEKGVTYLYEVLKTDSNDYITHHLIGKVFINTSFNDINKAEKYFLISQKLQGTNVMGETYSGLGLVAFNKGKYQEAEKNFLSAMALGITNANTYSYLCKIYEYAGNCDEMKCYAEKNYLLDTSSFLTCYNMGAFYVLANNPYYNEKKALPYFEKALKINPSDIATLNFLGQIYFNLQNYTQSKKCFSIVLKSFPNDFTAIFSMGRIFHTIENNFTVAKQYYDKAISINPNNPETYSLLSNFFIRTQNYKAALEYAQKSVNMNPQSGTYHFRLMQALNAVGDDAKAEDEYYQAIQFDPSLKNPKIEETLRKIQK